MDRAMVAVLCGLAFTASLASTAHAAVFEVPGNGGEASGIGYISGWKCPPNTNLTAVIDGGAPLPLASGIRRGDTASACGNSGLNGYISQLNFGNLGDGFHTASIRQNGVQFAQGTFFVTTFGTPFLTGAAGTYTLQNFPQFGQTATVEWSQGAQNFIITGKGGSFPVAQVRYGNQLSCNGSTFTSQLSANGFSWLSTFGGFSAYQQVNRSSLGPFVETNTSACPNQNYSGLFALTQGRRYAFVQTIASGVRVLLQFDEGSTSAEAQGDDADPAQLVRDRVPVAALYAVDGEAAGAEAK